MSRHVADRRSPSGGDKTRVFLDLARKDGQHPAVAALRQRPGQKPGAQRIVQFLRIARGRTV